MREVKDPHKELSGPEKGELSEEQVRELFHNAKGFVIRKLCDYDKDRKPKFKLNSQNVTDVLRESNLTIDEKAELLKYLKDTWVSLPDFIIRIPTKGIFFLEVKYNTSTPEEDQKKVGEEIEKLGYQYLVVNVEKFQHADQTFLIEKEIIDYEKKSKDVND